jgi:hypothetical protein
METFENDLRHLTISSSAASASESAATSCSAAVNERPAGHPRKQSIRASEEQGKAAAEAPGPGPPHVLGSMKTWPQRVQVRPLSLMPPPQIVQRAARIRNGRPTSVTSITSHMDDSATGGQRVATGGMRPSHTRVQRTNRARTMRWRLKNTTSASAGPVPLSACRFTCGSYAAERYQAQRRAQRVRCSALLAAVNVPDVLGLPLAHAADEGTPEPECDPGARRRTARTESQGQARAWLRDGRQHRRVDAQR